ncbi:uncharacterized protein LOC116308654 [Actinia tenebrosa]|uniref:Uncharacterized protein LOC116308654 n=1 Tax=Actinia tenebrosa TaxID=6105 RepID=A0A6P8J5L1_ACTTE|nr:uncharacterized protein LOC116308654 [Actinia tenebrosa]
MPVRTPENRFRALLLDLADHLTPEEFEKLKFLCKDDIPGVNNKTTTRDLFEKLIEAGKLSLENTGYLEKLLTNIHRVDLIKNELQKFIDNNCNETDGVNESPGAQTCGLRVKQTNFIGRNDLVERIAKVYVTGQKPMVAVVAPPGFGKTCVATHVGHAMKDKGFRVIYVSLQKMQSCHLMCCDILRAIDTKIPSSDDVVQLTKSQLKLLEVQTLLILDNAEDIQNSSHSCDFESFIEFLGSHAKKLKIFLGTRKSMYTRYFEHESINLLPLDDEASLKLLLALADGTSLNIHEAKKLAIQCAGVPLLIKIAAGLVKNGYNPIKLANNLQKKPYDVLNLKENEQIKFLTNSIQVFLDSLSREKLVCLVQLSCFPAQFTEDIANEILFKNEVKCSGMLSSLHASALVQLDGKNYSLHPLIQTFCREEQERMKCKKEGEKATEKFSNYYFDELEKLHCQFVSKDGCQKALKQFCCSKMNLLQALENALRCDDKEMKKRCIDAFNASINLLGKILLPSCCLSVYEQLYNEAERIKDKKRMSECLVSRGFRFMCEVNHGEFSQDAFDAFETALSLWKKNLFKRMQSTEAYAHCISKLGLCYTFKGDTEQGKKLINDAIPIRSRLGNKVLLAASYCDKAIAVRFCNKHTQAIEIFETRCLPVYKEHLGDHPWVASLLSYMSKCHQDLGCLEKAIECNKQSLEIREKLLGDHQDTARSYVRRGELFVEQENMKDALKAYRKAASIQETVLGIHEETKTSYQAIEDILHKLNMDEERQKYRKRAETYSTEIKNTRTLNKQISEDIKRRANSLSVFPGLNMITRVAVVVGLVAVIISCVLLCNGVFG